MNNFDSIVTNSLSIAQAKAMELKNTELASRYPSCRAVILLTE